MVPPDGYALADAFPGFLADDGSSIVVTEIPGTLAQLVEGLDEAGFATQGIELIDAAPRPFGLHDGWLYEGIQRVGDLEAVKWMAVVGNDRGAVLVTASVVSGDGLDARAAVLTTTYDQDRVFDPLEGLAYAIDAAAPLRYAGRVANSLTYNTSGTTPSADPLEPLLSVGPSLGGAPIDDRTGFAHARLAQIPLMDDADIEAEAAVEIDGLEGIEILATAVHASGEPIALLQTTLFPDAGYVLIVGRCRVRDAQQFVPLFREMAASFRRSAP
jgi:hypothetical protein